MFVMRSVVKIKHIEKDKDYIEKDDQNKIKTIQKAELNCANLIEIV